MDWWPGGREEGMLICKQEPTNYAQHAEQAEQGGVRDPKSLLVPVTGTSSTRKVLSPRPQVFHVAAALSVSSKGDDRSGSSSSSSTLILWCAMSCSVFHLYYSLRELESASAAQYWCN